MTQIGFSREDAHEALDDFLNGDHCERWVSRGSLGGQSGVLCWIVPDEAMAEYRQARNARDDVQEIRENAVHEPAGYAPFRHSPKALGGERLLPIDRVKEHLARAFFGKDVSSLDETESAKVMGAAIMTVLDVSLDPDGQGAVPIMTLGHSADGPGDALRWKLAFVTGVPGLYLRVTANGFLGEEWGILTGSGYRLASGWYSRDMAERACDALGRVLPDTDWMRMTPDMFSPAAKKAVAAVIKRYHFLGLDEKAPEPEPAAVTKEGACQ